AGEQRRAVDARGDVDLALDRPDLVAAAAVGPLLVDCDPAPDRRLLDRAECPRDLVLAGGIGLLVAGVGRVLRQDRVLDRLDRLLAGELLGDAGRLVDGVAVGAADLFDQALVAAPTLGQQALPCRRSPP